MEDRLPAGIHFRAGESPPDFFSFLTFDFLSTATPVTAAAALTAMWEVLGEVRQGIVRDLQSTREGDPVIRVNGGDLQFVLCFGPKLFDPTGRGTPLVPVEQKPDRLPLLGGSPNGPFPQLKWVADAQPGAAQTDFAIQLTGTSELSVRRPIVELQKVIDDKGLPVKLVRFFTGLHREDRRSWIDFHDGINNMRSDERQEAMEIVQAPQAWLVGGTTVAFLRIAVDLQGWRQLSREQQEALVGRDKLSGCPLEAVTANSNGSLTLHRSGCPLHAEIGAGEGWTDEMRDPPPAENTIVRASHIHRANRTRQPPATDAARRVYRQGYEFIEAPPNGGVRLGLNFVGFQRDASLLLNILRANEWMGDANFGGQEGNAAVPAFPLMSLVAGGLFAVPPRGDPFPGHDLFAAMPVS